MKCTFYLFSMFAQKSVYCRCQRRKMKRQQVLESDATFPTTCSLFCEKIDCQPAPSKIHLPFTKDFPLSCCSPTCWELLLSSLAVDQLCLVRSGEIWKISHFALQGSLCALMDRLLFLKLSSCRAERKTDLVLTSATMATLTRCAPPRVSPTPPSPWTSARLSR